MDSKLITWLVDAGLDEQRAKIYLTNLSKGPLKASALAHECQVGRTAIYDNLKFLEERGYIHKYTQGSHVLYEALPPEELQSRFSTQLMHLHEILPDFMKLSFSSVAGPAIQLFKGKNSARNVFEDILKTSPKEYCYISNPIETYKTLTRKYIEGWIDQRVKKKIHARAIRTFNLKDPDDRIFGDEDRYLRKIRYLPQKIELFATIYIYGKNIGILSSYREEKSLIIRSGDLAKTMQQLFEVLWSISNRESS